ncbi:MAG TPA: efflux RND transporter periplasmic adaptor subunit [Polyangiaceae bacterium]
MRKRWARRVLGLLAIAGVGASVAVLLRPEPVPAEVTTASLGTMKVTIDESGRTRVRDRYVVLAALAGDLNRIELRAGDAVTRGQVIARIIPQAPALLDPRSRAEASARVAAATAAALRAQTEVARLELALQHARDDADRTARLVASGSVSPDEGKNARLDVELRNKELASARFGSETAAHEAELARAALMRYGDASKTRDEFDIASPIDGRVLRVLQSSEGPVAPSTPLLELGDPRDLEVVVDVLTQDAVGIPNRAEVTLDRWGGAGPLAGHVRLVEPSAFTRLSALGVEEQRVNVVIDFDDPPERRPALGDGYRVETHVVTWEGSGVLRVTASAAFREGGGWAVFVVVDDRVHLRPIEIGRRNSSQLEVLSGLLDGDRVVIHPSEKLADGVRVATL